MANNVYINNDLQLTLETNTDISGANTYQIRYKKPDGTVGYWSGSLVGTTQIRVQIDNADLDVAGIWTFKSYVSYATGEIYQGDPVTYEIKRKWQVEN